jgi:aminocarboxymuconate-semialdehyde decarboxylase
MPIIDFHNHHYPPAYIEALRAQSGPVTVTDDAEGNPVIHSPGDYNVAVPGHRDLDFRRSVLEAEGIDRQVLTLTSPGTHLCPPEVSVELARIVNDAFAASVAAHPDRFRALGTLPLNDPAASVGELERIMGELGLPGVMLFSNVNGVPLWDERFLPLYERADRLGALLYIHPIHPVGVEAMTEYWLMPLVGFTFDTTLAAAGLVFSGVVERFPRITWILCHLGGAIPYLVERLDRGYHAFRECRERITRPPSEYLKSFYYDTVNFDPNALELAVRFAGADHLLAGSDYPHMIGSLRGMVTSIQALGIPNEEKALILGGNAQRLLFGD